MVLFSANIFLTKKRGEKGSLFTHPLRFKRNQFLEDSVKILRLKSIRNKKFSLSSMD